MRTFRSIAAAAAVAFTIIIFSNIVIVAQEGEARPDLTVDAATRGQVIDALLEQLDRTYVFPDAAKKMDSHIRGLVEKGAYDDITSADAFAKKLTADLQSVSNDKHLRVQFSYTALPQRTEVTEPTAEEREQRRQFMKHVNFGFEKVERMAGNIGYIEFRGFFDPEGGADTVAAAMNFVANTDALIFDLRRNGGGDPAMVALVCSYLFGTEKVHLNDLYWRAEDRTDEFWTVPDKVKGERFVGKDVYVLTSGRTFSGAEEFSYNLKNLKRATIVGETTGGGAHPGGSVRLNDHFNAFVPTGRAISPITKTNWEGTGVAPDISVSKDIALETAYKVALEKQLSAEADENQRGAFKRLIDKTEKEIAEKSKAMAVSGKQ
jgi:hypothetical protein